MRGARSTLGQSAIPPFLRSVLMWWLAAQSDAVMTRNCERDGTPLVLRACCVLPRRFGHQTIGVVWNPASLVYTSSVT